jgi:hypothetical protein
MIYILMTSKERIQAAINHREGDKVPMDSWLAPEVAEQLIKILEIDTETDPFALPKRLGNDVLYRAVGFCEGFGTIYDESKKTAIPTALSAPWPAQWSKALGIYAVLKTFSWT